MSAIGPSRRLAAKPETKAQTKPAAKSAAKPAEASFPEEEGDPGFDPDLNDAVPDFGPAA